MYQLMSVAALNKTNTVAFEFIGDESDQLSPLVFSLDSLGHNLSSCVQGSL